MMYAYNLFFDGESGSLYEVRLGVFFCSSRCVACALYSPAFISHGFFCVL
jgi:hypothetical protein